MSKTKNEERLEILNKRLAEIGQKQVNPIEESVKIEPETSSTSYPQENKKSGRLKTYILRIVIVLIGFLIIKYMNLGELFYKPTKEKVQTQIKNEVITDEKIKYNFSFNNDEFIIVFSEFDDKNEAIKMKEEKSRDFVDFDINYFFLPNKSNSKEEVYKLYAGPINGFGEAKHWYNVIAENIDPEAEIIPK
tara:strand:+ start:2434 stop:3006 length:573 start_codon:yes stop_codon:yes gene_type:complete